ncbi:MAG: ABC transporter substrate-binding protein [Chlorobi bacterium]|nr:ABC transporter substrate-binding protein [Chlorobiota bacterium]
MKTKGLIAFASVLAIVALAVGVSGCEGEEMPPVTTVEEISIGVVVPLTGQNESYGFPMRRGFELAREEINMLSDANLNITFDIVDDQSTVAGAKEAVQQLVDRGVPAIVGIAISTQLKDAFPIAQENGVVAFSSVSSAAGLSGIGDFIFRAPLATDILIPNGVMATREKLGYKKVAAIYDSIDVYSTSSNKEIGEALKENGVEILTVETFQTGDTDFSEQLTKIMDMEPDALFISALGPEVRQILIQGREIGIPESVHFIVPELSRDEVQKAGDAAEGAISFSGWSSMSDTPGNQAFIQNYRAKYGIEAELWAAQSYATLYILADAIGKAQSTESTAIRDALAQTMDFPTILGDFSFDSNGEAMYDPVVLIVKDGELQLFE